VQPAGTVIVSLNEIVKRRAVIQVGSWCCRAVDDGADTALWLVATRPDSKPGHFWHDSAERPTTFGWQRAEDPAKVAHFLEQVSAITDTPNEWVGLGSAPD
jgi:hypothetical protein